MLSGGPPGTYSIWGTLLNRYATVHCLLKILCGSIRGAASKVRQAQKGKK